MASDLGRNGVDFRMLKQKPCTVYVVLPAERLREHSIWLRLVITSALRSLYSPRGVPVLFMLDEFAQLGRLEVIERNMALMRGYGVKLWTIFQDLAQAKDIYERRWESFISNAGVRHVFAPQDVTTQEYFSKLSGQRIYWLKTTGTNTGQSMGPQSSISSGVTEGWTNIQGPAYWPQSLAAMETGKAVLFGKDGPTRTWLPDPSEIDLTRAMLDAAEAAAKRGRAPA
jgi:type IV secretion system protein VirD4